MITTNDDLLRDYIRRLTSLTSINSYVSEQAASFVVKVTVSFRFVPKWTFDYESLVEAVNLREENEH